jgi:prophage DNA circulation protein
MAEQPVTPNSIILGLPKMTFRGIESPPYDLVTSTGGWRQEELTFPYVDVSGHDNLGRKSMPFEFKLYFLNTAGGTLSSPSSALFPDLWNQWREAFIFNGDPGELVHPLFGPIEVRPTDWDIELSSNRQSGVIMTVSFSETNLDPEAVAEINALAVNLGDAAKAADQNRENIGIAYPDGERTPDLTELIGQLEGLIFSTRLTVGGYINQALGVVSGLIDLIELSQDTAKWAAVDVHLQVWNGLKDLGERLGIETPRPIATVFVGHKTSIDELAQNLGNTVGEIMSLNENLLGKPDVPAESTVKYFAS